jgi:hypothetical protein
MCVLFARQVAALRGWRSVGSPAGFFSTDAAAGASAAAGAAQGGSKSEPAKAASPGAVQGGSNPAAAAAVAQGSGGGGQDGKSEQDKGKSVRGGVSKLFEIPSIIVHACALQRETDSQLELLEHLHLRVVVF